MMVILSADWCIHNSVLYGSSVKALRCCCCVKFLRLFGHKLHHQKDYCIYSCTAALIQQQFLCLWLLFYTWDDLGFWTVCLPTMT